MLGCVANNMKFRTTDELLEFMNTIDLEKSTLVFKGEEKVTESDCGCGGHEGACACDSVTVESENNTTIVESNQVLIESFSDAPVFKLVEGDENIFFVKDYDAQRDACGTGSITLDDRVAYMNMCEMNNSATVTLDIITEGKKRKGVPFKLVKSEGESYLQVSVEQSL